MQIRHCLARNWLRRATQMETKQLIQWLLEEGVPVHPIPGTLTELEGNSAPLPRRRFGVWRLFSRPIRTRWLLEQMDLLWTDHTHGISAFLNALHGMKTELPGKMLIPRLLERGPAGRRWPIFDGKKLECFPAIPWTTPLVNQKPSRKVNNPLWRRARSAVHCHRPGFVTFCGAGYEFDEVGCIPSRRPG